MMSWLSLLFEAGLATLMAALIVYCVKLNRRLAALRSHDAEISEMITGLRDASERAEISVQRLKAAGLAAERSLRAAIEEANAAQARLAAARQAAEPAEPPARQASSGATAARAAAPAAAAPAQARTAKRDMLMGLAPAPSGGAASPPQERPKTREEAEETLLQAIRSARGGA